MSGSYRYSYTERGGGSRAGRYRSHGSRTASSQSSSESSSFWFTSVLSRVPLEMWIYLAIYVLVAAALLYLLAGSAIKHWVKARRRKIKRMLRRLVNAAASITGISLPFQRQRQQQRRRRRLGNGDNDDDEDDVELSDMDSDASLSDRDSDEAEEDNDDDGSFDSRSRSIRQSPRSDAASTGISLSSSQPSIRDRRLRDGLSPSPLATFTIDNDNDNGVDEGGVSGLVNVGNSCFLNAILQAFASLRSLEDYLHDNLESMDNVHQRTAHPILRMPVTEALEETLWYLNSSQRKRGANSLAMNAFRPRRIMDALSHNRRIMNLEQQDAQEAFQMISSALSDEMDVLAKVQRNVSSVHLGRTNSVELARRKAVGPFSGTLASRLTCAACGYNEAIRHFPFDNISLTLPLANQCLLTDTLASYVDIESLTDVVCRKCSLKSTKAVYEKRLQALKLSGNRRVVSVDSSDDDDDYDDDDDDDSSIETLSQKLAAVDYALQYDVQATLPEGIELKRAVSPLMTKQTMIARPPAILCLHISRSTLTPYGDIIKNRCHVHSPEFLDVTPYCTSGYLQTKHNEMISPLVTHFAKQSTVTTATITTPQHQAMHKQQQLHSNASNSKGKKGKKKFKQQQPQQQQSQQQPQPGESEKPAMPWSQIGFDNIELQPRAAMHIRSSQLAANSAGRPYFTPGTNPEHDLVMMEAASRGHLYRLQAVVVHYGSHSYGHFITFRRKRSNGTASTSNGLVNGNDGNNTASVSGSTTPFHKMNGNVTARSEYSSPHLTATSHLTSNSADQVLSPLNQQSRQHLDIPSLQQQHHHQQQQQQQQQQQRPASCFGDFENQPWYEVSDEIVAQVGSNRVLGANPYMLLYERVSSAEVYKSAIIAQATTSGNAVSSAIHTFAPWPAQESSSASPSFASPTSGSLVQSHVNQPVLSPPQRETQTQTQSQSHTIEHSMTGVD